MIMSWIWVVNIAISSLFALLLGRGNTLAAAIPLGAQEGLKLAFSIGGSLCLWTGVGKLMERAGITGMLGKLLRPLLGRLFPSSKRDPALQGALSGNICANILGLGNAATPMGIDAACRLKDPTRPDIATDELCRLIVLNTASIQLIPSNVAAIRAGAGSAAPFDILPAVWITSLCSAGVGLLAAWLMGKAARRD